jgi:RNA polymerase sigma-70 factor (ECF subfamily)
LNVNNNIVSAVRAGSPAAFAEIHAIYSRRLYRTILAITKSPEDAEDALQDTFMRAYLAIDTFEGRSSVYSWLTRIAINSALMLLRKRRARPEISFDPHPDDLTETICFEPKDASPSPEQECALHQRLTKLLRAIRKLSEHLREPIKMRLVQGASLQEIAQALNISECAVKSRLHRARVRLSAMREIKRCGAYGDDSLSAITKTDAALQIFDRSRISREPYSE